MNTVRSVLAIQHVSFEDLGSFNEVLQAQHGEIHSLEAPLIDFSTLDPLAPDLLVVLGGPIGAYEENAYPFLLPELALLRQRLAAKRPTLGICLGAQLMARALGARVYPAGVKEIGWTALTLTEAGERSCLAALNGGPVLHWHGDTFDLPEGATLLASTAVCAHQAFSVGDYALGLQFHPETTASSLERWFVGHAHEIAHTPAINVPQLRTETARYAADLSTRGSQMLTRWLASLNLSV